MITLNSLIWSETDAPLIIFKLNRRRIKYTSLIADRFSYMSDKAFIKLTVVVSFMILNATLRAHVSWITPKLTSLSLASPQMRASAVSANIDDPQYAYFGNQTHSPQIYWFSLFLLPSSSICFNSAKPCSDTNCCGSNQSNNKFDKIRK